MARRRGASSPGTVVTLAANTPGAPTFFTNRQFLVTAADNALTFTSYKSGVLLGGPSTLTITEGVYPQADYAAAWEDAINASAALDPSAEFTVTVTYNTQFHKLSIETSSTDFTLALTGVGTTSTAANRAGFYANKSASATLSSDTEAHGSGTITINIDQNGNGERVEYCIRNKTSGKFVGIDGAENAGELWGTPADFSNGGEDGRVTATGLTNFTIYTFDIKARDEGGSETGYGAVSASMATLPDLDPGIYNTNGEYEVSGGNTQIDSISDPTGSEANDANHGFYGDVTVPYVLQSYSSLTNNSIEVQFSENYDGEDPDSADWSAATMGTGGSGVSGLTASAAGLAKTYKWDSVADAGGSEYKQVGLRLRALDSDGAAAIWQYTDLFWVNNLPGEIAWTTTYPYDKDTTPELLAIIPSLRGGAVTRGFPTLEFRNRSTGAVVKGFYSFESIDGWWYETSTGVWVAFTFEGIPASAANGINRVKLSVPAGNALAVMEYHINGRMYETRDRG